MTPACSSLCTKSPTRPSSSISGDTSGIRLRRVNSIADVDPTAWDRLADPGYPFSRHAFLLALEQSGAVSPETGWTPHHLIIDEPASGEIRAAAPAYLKSHSYGEFVFDFSWANAHAQLGLDYYPKLVCAIPFTPCPGPRLLASDGVARKRLIGALDDAVKRHSSSHVLFAGADDTEALAEAGFSIREDVRFEWMNPGHAGFEDYLAGLSAQRRKKIRRERRRVAEAGVRHRWLRGGDCDDETLAAVYQCYARTYLVRGQLPYLNLQFWQQIRTAMPDALRICAARDESDCLVAASLCFAGADTLYGRHWGCVEDHRDLHFETCYYQGIEYCIEEGLKRFDAGVQGGHKFHRGFVPVRSHSAHRIADPRLAAAIERACREERRAIDRELRRLEAEA